MIVSRWILCVGVAVAYGCANGPELAPTPAEPREVSSVEAAGTRVEVQFDPPGAGVRFDTSILKPRTPAADVVIARIGELELRASHVFDRLVESNRRATRSMIDVLIMDVVIAEHAERHGITLDREEIEALIAREEELLRERVRIEWGARKSFKDYVRSQFDRSVDAYREFLRVELARERYRSYVIRFLAMLEDRVEVRLLVHREKEIVENAAQSVREGADFATLAYRHSEDETRNDGGLMPPFTRAFEHPVAKTAFTLAEGEVSKVFEIPVGTEKRWCVVYCVRRMAGRADLKFADVRDTLREGLEERGLTPFEQKAFILRWCGDSTVSVR